VLIHSLALEQQFAIGKLTATGSYHEKSGFITSDLTSRFGFAGLVPYSAIADTIDSEGYSFEARLVSPRGGKFDWLIGAMYNRTDEDIEEIASAPAAAAAIDTLFGPGLGALLSQGEHWATSQEDFLGEELALFGEGKYSFTDNFHLTAGGRLFKTRIDSDFQGDGVIIFFGSGLPHVEQSAAQDEQGFNPKLALSYDVTRDTQVYVLASKGFRFGGTNVNPGAPKLTFDSDSLWNYELGLKGQSASGELQFDLSAFHIDWSDIQLSLVDPVTGGSYTGNAGDATIDGVEAALSWGNPRGWQASTSIAWLDARLSEDFDPGFGTVVPRDAELPGASQWQVSNLLAYRFDNALSPHIVFSHRYVSEARGVLDYSGAPTGDYNILDLRAAFTIGSVSLTIFASNLTDERAVTAATYYSQPTALETHEYLMRPRTFGLTVAWSLQ
jgi:iron complex outermembrane recepter protein